jgi:tetratricopeptide (TPR) repeat protein
MKKVKIYIIVLFAIVCLLTGCSGRTSGSYYKAGMENFKTGNYTEAQKNIAKAIEINSERAEYYIGYGMTLIMLGKSEEALSYFDKAILDNDNSIVNKNNKLAIRGKGIAYLKSFQYNKAIDEFNKALDINELSELDMDILYYKGNAEEKAGLYEEAVKTYNSILKNNKSDADIYECRASLYAKLKSYDKSLADYDKAISLNKNNYNYYFGKYFMLLNSKNKEGAANVLNEAAVIVPKTPEDKYNLAKVHYYMEDYERADKEFKEALKNGFTASYFYLGGIYEKKDDYQSAIDNYELFIKDKTTEKSAAVYNQLGYCLIVQGQYDQALTYILTGLEYNDLDLEKSLKHNEIIAYEKIGNFKEAYKLMTDFLASYPDDKDAAKEYEFMKYRLPEASTVKNTDMK